MKSYEALVPFFLFWYFLGFTSVSISAGIFLKQLFRTLYNIIWKILCRKFSFFNEFTQLLPHHHLYCQNLRAKSFLSVFPKRYSKIFFFSKICLENCAKGTFYLLAMSCCFTYICKNSNNRFSGLLFRTYFKNSYFLVNNIHRVFLVLVFHVNIYNFVFKRLI